MCICIALSVCVCLYGADRAVEVIAGTDSDRPAE